MEEDKNLEKRQFRRMLHSQSVKYQFKDPSQFGGCVSRDLSEGGVRVRLSNFVPLNTELTLKIRLADENIVECASRVIWVEKSRFGESYQAGLEFAGDEAIFNNQEKIHGFLSYQ